MKDSIILHPEWGLNPTISQCFLCGEDKNEIALLGNAYRNQAPMHMILDIEPCEKCREKHLSIGTMVVEVEGEEGRSKPTGNAIVVRDEAFNRMFSIEIPKGKIVFCSHALFNMIFKDAGK